MKTVVVSFKNIVPGDQIVVEYSDVRGGCHGAKQMILGPGTREVWEDGAGRLEVVPGDTPRDLALRFAQEINTDWMKEAFSAKVKDYGDKLIIGCSDLVAQRVVFRASVAGAGGTTVEIEEF